MHQSRFGKIDGFGWWGLEIIITEEVMGKLYMFQDRFGKIDEFGWWDLERISVDAGT